MRVKRWLLELFLMGWWYNYVIRQTDGCSGPLLKVHTGTVFNRVPWSFTWSPSNCFVLIKITIILVFCNVFPEGHSIIRHRFLSMVSFSKIIFQVQKFACFVLQNRHLKGFEAKKSGTLSGLLVIIKKMISVEKRPGKQKMVIDVLKKKKWKC